MSGVRLPARAGARRPGAEPDARAPDRTDGVSRADPGFRTASSPAPSAGRAPTGLRAGTDRRAAPARRPFTGGPGQAEVSGVPADAGLRARRPAYLRSDAGPAGVDP